MSQARLSGAAGYDVKANLSLRELAVQVDQLVQAAPAVRQSDEPGPGGQAAIPEKTIARGPGSCSTRRPSTPSRITSPSSSGSANCCWRRSKKATPGTATCEEIHRAARELMLIFRRERSG